MVTAERLIPTDPDVQITVTLAFKESQLIQELNNCSLARFLADEVTAALMGSQDAYKAIFDLIGEEEEEHDDEYGIDY